MKRKTYVTLLTNNRIIPIGHFSESQINEWQRHGQQSYLWRSIVQVMDTNYQNDTLTAIQARGATNNDWDAHYQSPAIEKRPITLGYGPMAGMTTTEVWA